MIKTITAYNTEDLDRQVNELEENKNMSIFATQTHVNYIVTFEGYTTQYTAIVFYKQRWTQWLSKS